MLFSHFVVDDNFVRTLPSRYTVGLPASERSYHGNEDKDNDVLGARPMEFSDWNLKDFSIPPSFWKRQLPSATKRAKEDASIWGIGRQLVWTEPRRCPSQMNFLTTLAAQRPFPRKRTTFILTLRRLFLRRTGSSFSRDLCWCRLVRYGDSTTRQCSADTGESS